MTTNSIKEAVEAATQARDTVAAAQEAVSMADAAVVSALNDADIIFTGCTTHQYAPLDEHHVEKRVYWTQELVHVEAVKFDQGKDPVVDRMLVRRLTGAGDQWLVSVLGSTIEIASPDMPRDGSYICKTCKPPRRVQAGENHPHGCPVDGGTCASRDCNILGSCRA